MAHTAPHRYTTREKLFGPVLTDDDVIELELRATREDWYDVLQVLLAKRKTRRAKRFLLAYLRDGLIEIEVHHVDFSVQQEDVYEDENPYEGIGER